MKVVSIINVILQGLCFIGTISSIIFSYYDGKSRGYAGNHFNEDLLVILVIAAILLGGYQVLHAFVMSIIKLVKKEFGWLMGIYWLLGLAYVFLWMSIFFMSVSSFIDEILLFKKIDIHKNT